MGGLVNAFNPDSTLEAFAVVLHCLFWLTSKVINLKGEGQNRNKSKKFVWLSQEICFSSLLHKYGSEIISDYF